MSTRRILSCILLPAYLSSCTSWQVPPVGPEQAIVEDQPSRIQLTLTDSSTFEMRQPAIVEDTLRGIVEGPPSRDAPQGATYSLVERVVPSADIATLRVAKTDATKSILLGLGIVAGAIAVFVAALALSGATFGPGLGDVDACFICGG